MAESTGGRGRGGFSGSSAPGRSSRASAAGRASRGGGGGGPSGTLSADLGGGLSANIDARTGDVTSFSGPGALGGVIGAQLSTGVADVRSAFGNFLSSLTPEQIGAAGGALAGTLLGVGPLAGAKLGAIAGKAFGQEDAESAQQQAAAPAQAAPTQAGPSLAGVSPAGQQLGGQVGGRGRDGGVISQPAQQLAATGRQSGLAPAQTPFQQPQNQFLNRLGPLPTVNLQAFPGALGRV
jgi:hypothetical protein